MAQTGLWDRIKAAIGFGPVPAVEQTTQKGTTFEGYATARDPYIVFQVDHEYASVMADINRMDREDGRVKRIHSKIARDATRGGLSFSTADSNLPSAIATEAKAFLQRCKFDRETLLGHARFLVKDGEIFLQNVVNEKLEVIGMKRLPPTSMRPNVDAKGEFRDLTRAYIQYDLMTNREIAAFPLWQIVHKRIDANPDDPGDRGRPWLDASRVTHKKLTMTEEDLVIRRRVRAPRRNLHVLEGVTEDELQAYKKRNQDVIENPLKVGSDYFSNRKGSIQPIEGDANLDQINDVKELKDDFFAGAGFPAHLLGYMKDVNRDVVADSLEAYYEILEEVQEILADGYEQGLRLQLLLRGINSDGYQWDLKFQGRKVESENELADRMLKHHALGVPKRMIWPKFGYAVEQVDAARKEEATQKDPYRDRMEQEIGAGGPQQKITNVNGNRRKGESAVSIKN